MSYPTYSEMVSAANNYLETFLNSTSVLPTPPQSMEVSPVLRTSVPSTPSFGHNLPYSPLSLPPSSFVAPSPISQTQHQLVPPPPALPQVASLDNTVIPANFQAPSQSNLLKMLPFPTQEQLYLQMPPSHLHQVPVAASAFTKLYQNTQKVCFPPPFQQTMRQPLSHVAHRSSLVSNPYLQLFPCVPPANAALTTLLQSHNPSNAPACSSNSLQPAHDVHRGGKASDRPSPHSPPRRARPRKTIKTSTTASPSSFAQPSTSQERPQFPNSSSTCSRNPSPVFQLGSLQNLPTPKPPASKPATTSRKRPLRRNKNIHRLETSAKNNTMSSSSFQLLQPLAAPKAFYDFAISHEFSCTQQKNRASIRLECGEKSAFTPVLPMNWLLEYLRTANATDATNQPITDTAPKDVRLPIAILCGISASQDSPPLHHLVTSEEEKPPISTTALAIIETSSDSDSESVIILGSYKPAICQEEARKSHLRSPDTPGSYSSMSPQL